MRDFDKPDIEVWALTDVVFVEDIRCAPIGRVLKVNFNAFSDTLCNFIWLHRGTIMIIIM